MRVRFRTIIAVAAASIAFAAVAHAEEKKDDFKCSLNPKPPIGFVAAQPLEKKPPLYPEPLNSEGWAMLRITIAADGSVRDEHIIDALGPKVFAESALRGVAKWRYQPATMNGKPVATYLNEVSVQYRFHENTAADYSQDFMRAYDEARVYLRANKPDEVIAAMERRMKMPLLLKEQAMGSFLLALAYAAKEDLWRAVNHIDHARVANGEYLFKSVRNDAAILQIDLYARLGQFLDAQCLYEYLAHKDPAAAAPGSEASQIAARIRPFIESKDPIAIDAKLVRQASYDEPASWSHGLLRSTFSFASPSTPGLPFAIRCLMFEQTGKIDTTTFWDIPRGTGGCLLRVTGPADATFKVIEEHGPTSGG